MCICVLGGGELRGAEFSVLFKCGWKITYLIKGYTTKEMPPLAQQ